MGGDYAPVETVKGAVEAVNENSDISVTLFGIEEQVRGELAKYSYDENRITIVNCPSVIETSEPPAKAIRQKKDSSIVQALYSVKRGECDAFVSCGNTGALLVGGQVIIGRAKGVERPAMGFQVPSSNGPVMIIDCGASVDAKPEMLVQFAQMGAVYMRDMAGIKDPRVGIINIGEEDEKGNALVKETLPLLRKCKGINFTGSVESRAIASGGADVVVCDAFVGNSLLKMYEGVAGLLVSELTGTLKSGIKTKIGALFIKNDLKKTMKKFSSKAYGGAPMLGLKAPLLKTHGNSKAEEIKNTILQCRTFMNMNIASQIENLIALNNTESDQQQVKQGE